MHELDEVPQGAAKELAKTLASFMEHQKSWNINGLTTANVDDAAVKYARVVTATMDMIGTMKDRMTADWIILRGEQAADRFNRIADQEPVLDKKEVDQAIRYAAGVAEDVIGKDDSIRQTTAYAVKYAQYNHPEMAPLWSVRSGKAFNDPQGHAIRKASDVARMCAIILALGEVTDRRLAATS